MAIKQFTVRHWAGGVLSLLLAACGSVPVQQDRGGNEPADGPPSGERIDLAMIPDAVPRVEARSKYGNPAAYSVYGREYRPLKSSTGYVERGIASWYGKKFQAKRTSSGEPYDLYAMTAAHKTLPLPTYAEITNLENGRRVVVKVNDRGPFHDNRLIDLSYAAAAKLGVLGRGTGLVEVRALDPEAPTSLPTVTLAADPVPRPSAIYLQIGAFAQRDNAERLRTRLQTVAPAAAVTETRHDEGALYRVRIGPLDDAQTADRLTQSLSEAGFGQAAVVVD